MSAKTKQQEPEAQSPLILRCHRLMEAFAKSDDERDFYLDRYEGFIVFVDLDKLEEELAALTNELERNPQRYSMIPKLTFFETKKIMEGFVNEKVYDIDTKEKLLDIIQSKEAREHFLEFIYDHHSELEKWQQYYQERSRIRIIEWLRNHHFHFVFEEDLDLSTSVIEKLKENLFEKKVARDVEVARKSLASKAKTYYSNEALNPRPKRGRPPKQAQKTEMEPQITTDIYTTVPPSIRPFLFTPEISSMFDVTFSSRFETGQELLASSKQPLEDEDLEDSLHSIGQKLSTLRQLSSRWMEKEQKTPLPAAAASEERVHAEDLQGFDEEERLLFNKLEKRKKAAKKTPPAPQAPELKKKAVKQLEIKEKAPPRKKPAPPEQKKAVEKKRIIPQKLKEKPAKPAAKSPAKKQASGAKDTAKRSMRKIVPAAKNTAKAKPSVGKTAKRPLRKTAAKKRS